MNRARFGLSLLVGALALASSAKAHASGFQSTERGVRPLGRGGAFVAGADDLGAVSYNPAGVFDAGNGLLVDASLMLWSSEYTRRALLRQVDPNTGETVATYEQTFPTVNGSIPILPIPTIIGSFSVHPDVRIALGMYAWNAAPTTATYPDALSDQPAPQRYALLSLDGSLLAVTGAWVAWRATPELRLGAGLEVLIGNFRSRQVLSGCLPDRFFCAPEDPEWDMLTEISAAPIIAPSGSLGAIWEFTPNWRLGGSFHLPYWIVAPATVQARLPSAPVFRNATLSGEDATIEFQLPWQLRLGLEARELAPGLRVEVSGQYDHWAIHDAISVTPENIALQNLPGFPRDFRLPEISLPRNFQSTGAVRAGAELALAAGDDLVITPRAGLSFETSAVPADSLSVLTLDAAKVVPSVGASVGFGRFRFDAVFAYVFSPSVDVDPADAKLGQVVPIQANPSENPTTINGGLYAWSTAILGLGVAYSFDDPAPAPAATTEPIDDDRAAERVDEVEGAAEQSEASEPAP